MHTYFRFAILVLLVGLLTGCARNYRMETSRGTVIITKGKPRYEKDRGVFVYRDINGVERTVPSGSVRQVAPASDTSSPTKFNPAGAN